VRDRDKAPEFSRLVDVGQLAGETRRSIVANEAERRALAIRFGLLGLERLEADVSVTPVARGIRLDAVLTAEVTQECVVTLEPVQSRIEERFSLVYGEAPEEVLEAEEEVVEPLPGAALDIGEAVAQQLSLALDPYPRAPSAVLPVETAPDDPADHPFAALARLKTP
jgi:uncharacterized metal-binding protein YceD (DUF177 family)